MPQVRVGILDDHPLFRVGVLHAVNNEHDMRIVGESSGATDALVFIQEHRPDVLIMDVMNTGSSVSILPRIVEKFPGVKNCILTFCALEDQVCAAMAAGAKGYVLKSATVEEFILAVRAVHRGDAYVSSALAAATLKRVGQDLMGHASRSHRHNELTHREEQIFSLVASGLRNKEIGLRLDLTEKTVKHYVTNIFGKLNVRNRVEAAMVAQLGRGQDPARGLSNRRI